MNNSNPVDCKFYVCSRKKQECIAFNNKFEYTDWFNEETTDKQDYVYSAPICDKPTFLHHLTLCLRNNAYVETVPYNDKFNLNLNKK
jgi:hypothetical protein